MGSARQESTETMSSQRPIPDQETFRFRCLIEVRFRDLDAMGHVNNAVYFTYFEVARAAYMRALGHLDELPLASNLGDLFPFILAEASCRYLAPVGLGEVLVVSLRTSEVKRKSFEFEYLVTRQANGQPVAVGRSIQVYYNYDSGRTKVLPGDFLQRLETIECRTFGADHG